MKPWHLILFICSLLFLMYGGYWVLKNGSYYLWYEDMVKETIQEMVKEKSLKDNQNG